MVLPPFLAAACLGATFSEPLVSKDLVIYWVITKKTNTKQQSKNYWNLLEPLVSVKKSHFTGIELKFALWNEFKSNETMIFKVRSFSKFAVVMNTLYKSETYFSTWRVRPDAFTYFPKFTLTKYFVNFYCVFMNHGLLWQTLNFSWYETKHNSLQ